MLKKGPREKTRPPKGRWEALPGRRLLPPPDTSGYNASHFYCVYSSAPAVPGGDEVGGTHPKRKDGYGKARQKDPAAVSRNAPASCGCQLAKIRFRAIARRLRPWGGTARFFLHFLHFPRITACPRPSRGRAASPRVWSSHKPAIRSRSPQACRLPGPGRTVPFSEGAEKGKKRRLLKLAVRRVELCASRDGSSRLREIHELAVPTRKNALAGQHAPPFAPCGRKIAFFPF